VSDAGAALAAAAERLVGVPYRLHGRDPATGLDCVGLVAAALSAIGRTVPAPSGYQLRRLRVERLLGAADDAVLREATGPVEPGDILLLTPGPGQHHLAVAAADQAAIHAHAGLGRVVRTPAPLPWPTERRWRLPTE